MEILKSWKFSKPSFKAKKEYILKTYLVQKYILTEQEAVAIKEYTFAKNIVKVIVE